LARIPVFHTSSSLYVGKQKYSLTQHQKKEKEKKNRKVQQSVVGAKTDICRANISVCVGARICWLEGGEGGGQEEIQV